VRERGRVGPRRMSMVSMVSMVEKRRTGATSCLSVPPPRALVSSSETWLLGEVVLQMSMR